MEVEGLPGKLFNAWFDQYRITKVPGSIDDWALMNPAQQNVVNELKKSINRERNKNN